jgi:hypothetical protein
MIKTFTQNDLLRYIYQETTKEENTELETAVIFDDDLSNDLSELKQTVLALDGVEKSPSKFCIEKILDYSKTYQAHAVN